MKPTQEQVALLFSYDSKTGVLVRKITVSSNAKAGAVVGSVNSDGYLCVGINKTTYKVHQIIWLLVNGKWPNGVIDHINRIKVDNRIENLRDTTVLVNNINKGVRKDSNTGVTNVTWRERDKRFYAACRKNGKQNYIGSFTCIKDAANAVAIFKSEIGKAA